MTPAIHPVLRPDAPRIMVGIPCYTGDVAAEMATGLVCSAGLFSKIDWMIGCCHIGIARDLVANHFVADEQMDKLLFIDTDMVFTPADFKRITSHDLPIVAGLYKGRSDTGKEALCPMQEGEELVSRRLLQVRRAGTGFMCVRKDALLRIMKEFPNRWYQNDSGDRQYHFFPAAFTRDNVVNRMVVQTDDFGFCDLATAAGIEVHVDLGVNLGHKGSKVFRIQFQPNPTHEVPA